MVTLCFQYLYDFLDAIMTQETSPEEAYRKFDELASKHVELLRKHTKQVQEARDAGEEEGVKRAVSDYDDTLDRYIPVLMAQAKIYWDMENYSQVENFFHKSVEFCDGNETWRLHVSHVLYMQDKFKEAIAFYEPIVKKYSNNLLNVSAIVLANLCVSYIMTSQNEEAEDLMRKIEKEEERIVFEEPNKKTFHLCIVNLVIGNTSGSEGVKNFTTVDKHIERINRGNHRVEANIKLVAVNEQRIGNVFLYETTARVQIQECITFLEQCEVFGKDVPTVPEQPLVEDLTANHGKHTVTYEARLLKSLLLKLFY
ncbi:tetratricopeptide repeat protein 30A [Diaphorina citri]|uniref:Tetratricopeptide repeat protein 30 n=1 Tax=Diaphorina citri TaxID=121845 RepID=A0A3Q0JMU8_DIACI|nr:tetratricopeptide repeat protein 30A [Diaphorina citri]